MNKEEFSKLFPNINLYTKQYEGVFVEIYPDIRLKLAFRYINGESYVKYINIVWDEKEICLSIEDILKLEKLEYDNAKIQVLYSKDEYGDIIITGHNYISINGRFHSDTFSSYYYPNVFLSLKYLAEAVKYLEDNSINIEDVCEKYPEIKYTFKNNEEDSGW